MSCALLFRSHWRLLRWGVVGGGGGEGGICETVHYGISDVTVVSKAVGTINKIEDWERDKRHFLFETCTTLYCLDLTSLRSKICH